jgi:hypothetical protein
MAAKMPPNKPSHVFPGEIFGTSLFFPSALPAKYAAGIGAEYHDEKEKQELRRESW